MSAGQADDEESRLRHRAKQALRKQMRAVREALPSAACDARSLKISERVLGLQAFQEARTVLAFASIHNEVRTDAVLQAAWASGKRVLLPRVVGETLELCRVGAESNLVQGAYSVPEPGADAEQIDPVQVDFALVPALAVDSRGFRIGYGGGYYDRLLPELGSACTCALAYDFQLLAEMPNLPFDVAVDLVVTDERVIHAG